MNVKISKQIDWRLKVFDSLSFPILILTPERTIVSANRKFLEKIQLPEQRVIGKTCREIFENEALEGKLPCSNGECPLEKTLIQGTGHSILKESKDAQGRTRWEDRVFSPILDENGDVIYIIESIRDVTRTKRLEQMIHDFRDFLDRIIQSSASPIIAADRKGRVLLMNPAAKELFGHDFQTAGRLNVWELYPEGTAKKIMKKLRDDSYGGRGKLPLTQVDIRTASGKTIPVEMTAGIIYEESRELATMGIFNDLREKMSINKKLKEAEAQVIQSEKLASLGRLAAGVAHEINNPLTGILMYGNMMLEKIEDNDPFHSYLNYVLEDAERCQDIVKNLLAYSRQTSTCREVFTLNALIEESLNLIRDQRLFVRISTVYDLFDSPLQVYADRKKLRQVVIILVMNAIDAMDAMDKEGVLTLRTYPGPGGQSACFQISDTGKGIPQKNLTKIFEPFFTTKEPGKGTGLGLSTAYGIVSDNKGVIDVKSTGPGGTAFEVRLPLGDKNSGVPESIG
ncbi:MAG: PAS domain S-box protein [Desulfobacteraceae bacterium]|nr:PAS domain S-box protein [Desulfobacteraceae bacterium]